MNILVTGGAGFIGSHIVDALVEGGHDVVVLDDLSTGRRENINTAATFVHGDVRNPDLINSICSSGAFDVVNHHAAQLDVRVSVRDPRYDAELNILGSLNVLNACARSGVKGVVFASSGGTVYGDQRSFPASEDHPTDPVSPYGVAKLAVEKYLYVFQREHGLSTAALRYTNVYGPRQNPHGEAGVVAIFCNRLVHGTQPIVNGDGSQTRDYVFVRDVVRANMLAVENLVDGAQRSSVFNVCSNTETSVVELFGLLNELFAARLPVVFGAAQPGEQMRSRCTYERIEREWGWRPEIPLTDGLRQTVAWYQARDRDSVPAQ